MSLKKVEKFSLYLYKIHKIDSILKIQKILFFLRVYEKIDGKNFENSPIFGEKKNNFQAWMYGPVNIDSYEFMRYKLQSDEDEGDDDVLLDFEKNKQINKLYSKYNLIIDRLKYKDSHYLVYLSHHNKEYKRVRGDIKEFEPCCEYLDEKSKYFIEFDEKVEDKISEIFYIKKSD